MSGNGPGHRDGDVLAVDRDAVPLLALGVLAGVGALVVLGTSEVVLGVLGARTRRERLGVERAADAERDLFGGDGLAVLPRGVVTNGEGPLGVVLVVGAEVGGEVRDQHGLAILVADVLGQRPARERLLDRVARDEPSAGRVERVGARVAGEVDRDGPSRARTLDRGSGTLAPGVLAACPLVGPNPAVSPVAGPLCRSATAGSEGQQSSARPKGHRQTSPTHPLRSRQAMRRTRSQRSLTWASPPRLAGA